MNLSRRLGVPQTALARTGLPENGKLPESGDLLTRAYEVGPSDPETAQALLATAILSQAQSSSEGRLSAALKLLARLVAKADPDMTLGPDGAEIRSEVMPNGWRYTISSWPRLRYAWREGLWELLQLPSEEESFGEDGLPLDDRVPLADTMDEITRMDPGEPEPISVAIQEQWPAPPVALAISLAGLGISLYGMYATMRETREVKAEMKKRRKKRIRKRIK